MYIKKYLYRSSKIADNFLPFIVFNLLVVKEPFNFWIGFSAVFDIPADYFPAFYNNVHHLVSDNKGPEFAKILSKFHCVFSNPKLE